MMLHHVAILEDIARKRASLQEQMKQLDSIERYHLREVELFKMLNPNQAGEPRVSPSSQLYGKTMAEACEAALMMLEAARSIEVAECLAMAFDYGDGAKNRSYVNALYNAMTRKPDVFANSDGVWTLRGFKAQTAEMNRQRLLSKPR